MLRFPTLTLALMLGVSPAFAGMLPAYDAQAICSDLAGTSVKQEVVMRGCLDFQERIRKEVALAWDALPGSVQDICGKAAEASGDYWRLKSCIDREARSAPATEAGR
jgi:hypothetical protein